MNYYDKAQFLLKNNKKHKLRITQHEGFTRLMYFLNDFTTEAYSVDIRPNGSIAGVFQSHVTWWEKHGKEADIIADRVKNKIDEECRKIAFSPLERFVSWVSRKPLEFEQKVVKREL
jgi:hypothetical protein